MQMRSLTRPAALAAILALVVSLFPVLSASAEVWPAPPAGGVQLNAVQFIDGQHGWAVGGFNIAGTDYGVVERTTDGGATWVRTTVNQWSHYFRSVSFVSASVGYAVGETPDAVYKTVDGGATWTKQTITFDLFEQNTVLRSVRFSNATDGYVVGHSPRKAAVVWGTGNGGATWTKRYEGPEPVDGEGDPLPGEGRSLETLSGYDSTHLLAVGNDMPASGNEISYVPIGYKYDGSSWTTESMPAGDFPVESASYANATNAMVVGLSGKVALLSGASWTSPSSGVSTDLHDVSMIDSTHAWVAGESGVIRFWNGSAFSPQASGTTARLRGISFRNATTGWAVGDNDTMLRTTDGGAHWVARDEVAPATTISGVPAGWTNGDVGFKLQGTDSGSGVAASYYMLGGGVTNTYGGTTVTVSGEGSTRIDYWSVDSWGNTETPHAAYARIDLTKPSTTDDHVATYVDSGTIHLTPSDALSGVASTRWSIDGANAQSGTSVPVSGLGPHTLTYRSTDIAGNVETTKTANYTVIRSDATSPTTSISGVPAGWSTTNVTFTLTPSDEPTNTLTSYYRYNGTGSWLTYATPVTLSAEGTTVINYYSKDQADNAETPKNATARIDKTSPVTTATTAYGDGSAVVTLHPTDSVSGVATTRYTVDGGTPQTGTSIDLGAGVHIVTFWSTDVAGNEEAHHEINVNGDTTKPVTSIITLPSGWSRVNVPFTLTASDEPTNTITIHYRIGAGALQSHTGTSVSDTVSAEGTTTIEYWSEDQSGNTEDAKTGTVKIDKGLPSSTFTTSGAQVTLSASDPVSGVAARRYRIDSGPDQTYGGSPFTVPGGTHTVYYWAVDNAGNAEVAKSFSITVPITHVTFDSVEGPTRFETAIQAVGRAFPGSSSTVVIAWGRNFPDALGASALCGAYDAPLLLTETNSIPLAVKNKITQLGATHAVIIGSESVVSRTVADELAGLVGGPGNVDRVYGDGRYDTAQLVASEVARIAGARDDVFLAVGDNFPDALAASPAAFAKKWPIVLTARTGLSSQAIGALTSLHPARVHILGSTGAVPQIVENQLRAAFPSIVIDRWQGDTRYQTAVDIANRSGLSWSGVGIATGQNFPDALAGGVMQGRLGGVVLLTPTASLNPYTEAALIAHKPEIATVRYLGSGEAVGPAVRTRVSQILQ